ncbi:RhuM family protein [Emticicia sp. CRIBPO]|uniref:RhuM family protein n=1 Tax=Emticicia sp. CRIBPO TaxID=2683258 RepID=UPI00197AF6BA
MAVLFSATKQNISLYINNIYKEGELEEHGTVKEYLMVQAEGKRKVNRLITFYNLDTIISVGYRVKSFQGTQFRIWATQRLQRSSDPGLCHQRKTTGPKTVRNPNN